DVDRGLLGDDAAGLGTTLGAADAGVLLDPVHALDDDPVLGGVGRDDLALGALVPAGDDEDGVPLLHLHRLQHLRGERNNLHEPLVPQLTADRAEDTGTARVPTVLDDDGGVLVEADVRAVRAALLLRGTHDDGLDHVALLHAGAGDGVLHGGHDDIADA